MRTPAAVLLAAGFAAFAFWFGDQRGEARASAAQDSDAGQRAERLERALEETRAEVALLRSELAALKRRVHDSAGAAAVSPSMEPGAEQAAPDAAREESAESESDEDYHAFVRDAFEAELSDPGWGAAAELRPKLMAALPPGSVLRALDCRASLCRVETTHANHDGYRAFSDQFLVPDRPLWDGASFFHVTHAPERPGDELAAVIYLGRGALPTAEPPR